MSRSTCAVGEALVRIADGELPAAQEVPADAQ